MPHSSWDNIQHSSWDVISHSFWDAFGVQAKRFETYIKENYIAEHNDYQYYWV